MAARRGQKSRALLDGRVLASPRVDQGEAGLAHRRNDTFRLREVSIA